MPITMDARTTTTPARSPGISAELNARIGIDIWRAVLEHVQRPKPQPGKRAEWSELHQDDLARCMRVNQVSTVWTGGGAMYTRRAK